ncbi:MAG: hypothetical protein RR475_09420 [Clostridia bacterium]
MQYDNDVEAARRFKIFWKIKHERVDGLIVCVVVVMRGVQTSCKIQAIAKFQES